MHSRRTRFAYQDLCIKLSFVRHVTDTGGLQVHLSLLLLLLCIHTPHVCPIILPVSHHLVSHDFTSWCLSGNRVITRLHFPNTMCIYVMHPRSNIFVTCEIAGKITLSCILQTIETFLVSQIIYTVLFLYIYTKYTYISYKKNIQICIFIQNIQIFI